MKNTICFDDVLLQPQFSDILSRSEIDLSVKIGRGFKLDIPIISSPMDTVTSSEMTTSISKMGGLGIIHRYNSISEQSDLVREAIDDGASRVGAAIGVSGDYLDRAANLVAAGARIICVDIAHGHHAMMRYALETLKNTYGSAIHFMAGNVATLEAFNALSDWGADSIRVGIGGGSICSTRVHTGHGTPTLQSIIDCSSSDRDSVMIADGGIRTSGDIVKALAAGADCVMLGSLLAGTNESPGEIVYFDGHANKVYRGMASKDAQIEWRGHTASIEGVSTTVAIKGAASDVISELVTGIRSGLSYSGARTILEMQAKSKFIKQTHAGSIESSTHINMK